MANIGYIGLGAMGSQMVDRLLEKGHTVTGYNRTRSKAEWLIEKRMQWADSPRQVAQAADVILSMVSNDAALLDVAGWPERIDSISETESALGGHEHGQRCNSAFAGCQSP